MKKITSLLITILLITSCSTFGESIRRDEALKIYYSKNIIYKKSTNIFRVLDFSGVNKKIINDDFKYIPIFPEVEAIHFSGCKIIADEDLKYLSGLNKLEILNFDDTNITDAGLKYLKDLKSLKELDLFNTKVTDKGIQELASVKSLTLLMLHGTKVTPKGIEELKKKLPKCYITLETREEIGYNHNLYRESILPIVL